MLQTLLKVARETTADPSQQAKHTEAGAGPCAGELVETLKR
jgi:hypothetical protein